MFYRRALICLCTGKTTLREGWSRIFSLSSQEAIDEANPSIAIFLFASALSLPFSLVRRVQDRFQEGFYNNIWQILGSVSALGGLLLVVKLEGGLPWLVVALTGLPVVATILNLLFQFWILRKWLRPRISLIASKATIDLLKMGGVFLALNLFTLVGLYSLDNFIISYLKGVSAVATYAVVQKLYSVSYLLWMFLFPLWPAYGESIARRDLDWVKQSFRYSVLITGIGGAALGGVLFFGGQWIIEVWTGKDLAPDKVLLAGFSFDIIVAGIRGSLA